MGMSMGMVSIYNQDCVACPLSKTRTQIVWYRGNPKAKIMLIGEAPGKQEDLEGLPFVGRSGALLDEALFASFGFNFLDYVYITNMVKCRPPENRNPTHAELNECSPFLQAELDAVKPSLVILLGKVACEKVIKRPVRITKEHGILVLLDAKTWGIPCLHPAYILRNQKPKITNSFFQVFLDAKEVVYGAGPNSEVFKENTY